MAFQPYVAEPTAVLNHKLLALRQRIEQDLRVLQINRVKAFGEPTIDRSKKIAGLTPLALIAPETHHAHRSTQFERLRSLLARNRERTREIRFGFRQVPLARHERDFTRHVMDVGFEPPFFGFFHHRHRFANAPLSIIKLTELGIGCRQKYQRQRNEHCRPR